MLATKTGEHTQPSLELGGLAPDPLALWRRLQQFLGLDAATVRAMRSTSETLLSGAAAFVADTYDYLSRFDETAAVLGWEQRLDEEHLRERRQFFATWLARSIGVDLSDEFAAYLFAAGQFHAGHGPRHIHTPEHWVLASVAMVQAHFAQTLATDPPAPELFPLALAGWNKYLMLQARQMLAGYRAACALDEGEQVAEIRLFGRLRGLAGREQQAVHIHAGQSVAAALRKFFDYHPGLRAEVFQARWRSPAENGAATWVTDFDQVYVPKEGPSWRILLNGKDIAFHGGLESGLQDGDVISLFPPGR